MSLNIESLLVLGALYLAFKALPTILDYFARRTAKK